MNGSPKSLPWTGYQLGGHPLLVVVIFFSIEASKSSRAAAGVTLVQLVSPGSLMLVKREPEKSSNYICLLVP